MKKFKYILVFIPFVLIANASFAQKTTKENLLEKKEKNLDSIVLNKQHKSKATSSSTTRTVGTVTNIEPAVIMGQNNFLTGNSASSFTENLRSTSNSTDWTFGNINLSDFTGNTDITGVVGGYNVALKDGSGAAQSVYANLLGAKNSGAGTTDFLVGAVIQVNALGSGTVDYARLTSSTLKVDDSNITVNYAQGMHRTLSLQNGTINNAASVLYLDYDVANTINITGDVSYIEAGEDVSLTSLTTGGEKRFIYYKGNLKSDFNGVINVNKSIVDLENATDKVLVTKEFVKNEFTLGKNQSPWNNTNTTNANQNSTDINYLNGNVGIGTNDTQGFKLGVNGNVAALDVKIDTYANWPDFVFGKLYQLPSLKQVEEYIQKNGHLENIPSAEKVKEDGFYLAKMNAKLLQKVEELTLYIINQDKRIKALEEKMVKEKK
ncbi:hypothetical protein H9I45_02750 [Polaribacter haliotis]|uniref:Peptidase S74 domain-containing protein n=1 Tax=Polaribacter haliotis TaxID=1888915 RepID=A0A7L8AH97_9FLAO|nr:hypothetical protein [Polaribacter haliotis]QOD61385.1 hypothetical protein H9I45_02750 [Polaribacter haliotis]